MTVRAYVPTTSRGLADILAAGGMAAPLRARAVTAAARVALPDVAEEDLEYAALQAAAADSAGMRGAADRPRRYVLAVDVATATELPAGDEAGELAVELSTAVPWHQVAAAHLDTDDDAAVDDDLAWFARQEVAHVLEDPS